MMVRIARIAAIVVVLSAAASGLDWSYIPSPAPRCWATLVLDTLGHRAVMFGGGTYDYFYNDVWEIVAGYRWQQVVTSGEAPRGRSGHSAVYDPIHNWMIVYGGRNGMSALTDVYALDLGTAAWQQLTPSGNHPLGAWASRLSTAPFGAP